jgi:hypothetical protein
MDRAPIAWRTSPAEPCISTGLARRVEQAGKALADLAQGGHLSRGLRAVLARHVLSPGTAWASRPQTSSCWQPAPLPSSSTGVFPQVWKLSLMEQAVDLQGLNAGKRT